MRRNKTFGTDNHTYAGRQVSPVSCPVMRYTKCALLCCVLLRCSLRPALRCVFGSAVQHLIEMMMRHQQRLKEIAEGKRDRPKGRQLYNGMNTSQSTARALAKRVPPALRPHARTLTLCSSVVCPCVSPATSSSSSPFFLF